MTIFNINAIKDLMPGGNHYSYVRIKNLMLGLRGRSTKKEIQQLRKILHEQWQEVDTKLKQIENQ